MSFVIAWMMVFLVAGVGFMAYAKVAIERASDGKVFREASEVPESRIGLLLGCRRELVDGRENLYFRYRIDACAELYIKM